MNTVEDIIFTSMGMATITMAITIMVKIEEEMDMEMGMAMDTTMAREIAMAMVSPAMITRETSVR